jgi:hypothetical protein
MGAKHTTGTCPRVTCALLACAASARGLHFDEPLWRHGVSTERQLKRWADRCRALPGCSRARGEHKSHGVINVFRKLAFFPLAAAVLGAACAYIPVHTDANAALIHACHSYDWAGSFRGNTSLRTTIANPLNESRLRAAIAARMQAMGVAQASGSADCLVGYGIGSQNVVVGGPYWGGWGRWGGGPYWGGWGGWYGPDVYREGVIGVDIYDGKSREPMWHAHADQDLTWAKGPEAQRRIDAAVQAIFAKYPAG